MRWRGRRQSRNMEDRRGRRLAKVAGGGGIGMILLALVAMYFGFDPSMLLDQSGGIMGNAPSQTISNQPSAADEELAQFTSVVLADTEDTWNQLFSDSGTRYQEPKLVLFSGAVKSACGLAQAAMGPFYCPGDDKVYIELGFYRDLRQRYQPVQYL